MSVAVGLGCALLGLVLGPFVAGLTLRVPAGEPIVAPGGWRGIPAGRQRVALVTALAVVVLGSLGAAIGAGPELPAYLWLGTVGVTLAVIDVDCFRLPDRLTLPSYPVGLVLLGLASVVEGDLAALGRAVLASVVIGGVALLVALLARGGGLGLGDVKLLGLLGLHLGWLGWDVLLVGVALGFAIGAAAAIVLLVLRRAGLTDHLAFGQWLIAGAVVAVVAGRPLADAYLTAGTSS